MEEIMIKLPEELAKEIKGISEIERSILISKLFKEKLNRLRKLKNILAKSQLTEEKAEEISGKINESLAKRYESL